METSTFDLNEWLDSKVEDLADLAGNM